MAKTAKAPKKAKGKIDLTDGVSPAEATLAARALSEYQPVPAPGALAANHTAYITLPDGRSAEVVQACSDRRDLGDYAVEHVYLACRVIAE